MRSLFSGVLAAAWIALLSAAWPAAAADATPSAPSLILRPAVVPLAGEKGQSVTWTLTLQNETDQAMEFALEARDVVVREGSRQFIEAGTVPGSIAATAVFRPAFLRIEPHTSGSTSVTFTLPPAMQHRAVVALFKGRTLIQAGNRAARTSLGTLFTFKVSDQVSARSAGLEALPPTPGAPGRLRTRLVNDGTEPLVATGSAVIIGATGRLMGKVDFPGKRLLPGEAATVVADYPGELPAGSYRAVATFDLEGKPLTQSTSLDVQ